MTDFLSLVDGIMEVDDPLTGHDPADPTGIMTRSRRRDNFLVELIRQEFPNGGEFAPLADSEEIDTANWAKYADPTDLAIDGRLADGFFTEQFDRPYERGRGRTLGFAITTTGGTNSIPLTGWSVITDGYPMAALEFGGLTEMGPPAELSWEWQWPTGLTEPALVISWNNIDLSVNPGVAVHIFSWRT